MSTTFRWILSQNLPSFHREPGPKRDRQPLSLMSAKGRNSSDFQKCFSKLKKSELQVTLIFLEASNDSLIRRYSETRRPHPLTHDKPIGIALREERRRLRPIKKLADTVIDTSQFNVHELRRFIADKFHQKTSASPLLISLISFGFKYGIPLESDLMFDVRFLPNPNFVRRLKSKTGQDKEVIDYIKSFSQSIELIRRLSELLLFLIPNYIIEGKSYLTISVGCTGGKHRSVMIANELNGMLSSRGLKTKVSHRDITH